MAGLFDDLVPPPAPDVFGDIVPPAAAQGAVPPPITTGAITAEPTEVPVPVRGRFVTGGSMGMQPADDLPTVADRAATAAAAANTHTLLGGTVNALTSGFYSGVPNPIDPNTGQPLPGPTPEQQAVTAEQAPAAAYAAEPPAQSALGQAATVLGTGVGMAASPESLVGGGEGYTAVREGAALIPAMLRAGGIQGVASATGDAGAQGLNIGAGEQTGGFSIPQVEQSFGMGVGLGALGPIAGAVVNVGKGLLDPADALFDDTVHGFAPEGTAPTLTPEAPSGLSSPAAAPDVFGDIVPPEGTPPNATAPVPPEGTPAPTPTAADAQAAQPVPQPVVGPDGAPVAAQAPPVAGDVGPSASAAPAAPTEGVVANAPEPPTAQTGDTAQPVPQPPAEGGPPAEPAAAASPAPVPGEAPVSAPAPTDLATQAPVPTSQDTTPGVFDDLVPPKSQASPSPGVFDDLVPPTSQANPSPAIFWRAPHTPAPAPEPDLQDTDGNFNKGVSPYVQIFRDAGYNPDLATSLPAARQLAIMRDHIATTFGMKGIEADPKQSAPEAMDQLANFYQNGREMSHALAMPNSALGLSGRVTLATKRMSKNTKYLGTYAPGSKTITIPGRSNSWAHEWSHALDHYLSGKLTGNPKARQMLSRSADTAEGNPGGAVPAPGSSAEGFAGVMRAIYGKDASGAAEALRLQYEARMGKFGARSAANRRLMQLQSEFVANASEQGPMAKYYSDPAELLARSHEAFVHHEITRNGGDTAAITKPSYTTDDDRFNALYPQEDDRARIFQAYRDMHDALRREQILGDHTAPRPDGMDIIDPRVWNKIVDEKKAPGVVASVKREVNAQKNFYQKFLDNQGFDKTATPPGRLTAGARGMDQINHAVSMGRTYGNRLVKRQPAGPARQNFQSILDRLLPAEHMRTAASAQGREIGPVFEEAVRNYAYSKTAQFGNILQAHKLGDMTHEEGEMLRHVLTEGNDQFRPNPTANPAVIPEHITKAAGQVRHLLKLVRQHGVDAGLEIGHAKSGFFPRIFDDLKIDRDETGFKEAATKTKAVQFQHEVGDDPEKLLEAHDRLGGDVKDSLDPETKTGISDLRKNLASQDKLTSQIETAADTDKPALQAKLDALKTQAAALHDLVHDPIRDAFATDAAQHWFDKVRSGDPTSFDTKGPTAASTKARVLPPEADELMRDYMVTDPRHAIPAYINAIARKAAYAERFGADGKDLEDMLKAAGKGGAHKEDIASMRRLVEFVTGRLKPGESPQFEQLLNNIHFAGTMALMPRSAWSSLSEPMSNSLRTGKLKTGFRTYANMVGHLMGTASSKQRTEMALAMGKVVSRYQAETLAHRSNAEYADSPRLSKILGTFYVRSGLTGLTNLQRVGGLEAAHQAMVDWAKQFLSGNRRDVRDAAADFRLMGIKDEDHERMAKWLVARPDQPSPDVLDTPEGKIYHGAASRLVDKGNQEPLRLDKPISSRSPTGRLMFGLMGFNYAWFHNIMDHIIDTESARFKESFQDARDDGSSTIGAAVKGGVPAIGRTLMRILPGASALYLTSLIGTTLRERAFNSKAWAEHEQAGDLMEWLGALGLSRTGVNGPLDPIAQAMDGLKYQRDLSGLTAGAQLGYFLNAAQNMLKPFTGAGSPNTNTAKYNAIKGAIQLFGVPTVAYMLSVLPGGPLTEAGYGAAMQFGTSSGVQDAIATALIGPKGSGLGGTPPPGAAPQIDPDTGEPENASSQDIDPNTGQPIPPPGQGGGAPLGIPVGLWDDILAPAARFGFPLLSRLPGPAMVIGGISAAMLAAHAVMSDFDRYKPGGDNNGE